MHATPGCQVHMAQVSVLHAHSAALAPVTHTARARHISRMPAPLFHPTCRVIPLLRIACRECPPAVWHAYH
eukprot:1617946-Lingulodinium_polyedra.AAC.1